MMRVAIVQPDASSPPIALVDDAITQIYATAYEYYSATGTVQTIVQSQTVCGSEFPVAGPAFALRYLAPVSAYWLGRVLTSQAPALFPELPFAQAPEMAKDERLWVVQLTSGSALCVVSFR